MSIRKVAQYLLLLAAAAGAAYAAVQVAAEPPGGGAVGKAAPPFAAADLQGESIRLADYRGKGVLLNFWASWCGPCVNELPLLNEAYKLTGVDMLAINVGEDAETARKFVDRYELQFPVALDREMTIYRQYRAAGLPLTVLIDKHGVVLERHEGEMTEIGDILAMMERIGND